MQPQEATPTESDIITECDVWESESFALECRKALEKSFGTTVPLPVDWHKPKPVKPEKPKKHFKKTPLRVRIFLFFSELKK
jgi:hypothetical protein